MNYVEELLVLSAGRGIGLDGFHKLSLVAPSNKETVLDRYRRQICDKVTVVVGYRAPELMARYPDLNFIYNYKWFESGSGFSAGLGLSRAPVIVVPSDLFMSDRAALTVRESTGNVIFVSRTENRPLTAVNVTISDEQILDIYDGPKRHGGDQEYRGIVRIESKELLDAVADTCRSNPSLAFSDCLAHHKESFRVVDLEGAVSEINSVDDYMQFFRADGQDADT